MKPDTSLLLALTGPVGIGKTTAAKVFEVHGFRLHAFADPVKIAASVAFNLTPLWLSDEYKNRIHPYWGMTPREMYQRVGTEAFQTEFGTDVWIRSMQQRLDQLPVGRDLITDVRPGKDGRCYEAEFVREQGGKVIHMVGPARREQPAGTAQHSSNGSVPFVDGDLTLYNTGTLYQLHENIASLLAGLETNHA